MGGFYGASIRIVNRSGSGKAAAKISYITRTEVRCLETGEMKHPSTKEDCLSYGIVFPDWLSDTAKERWSDFAQLAHDTEQAEKEGSQILRNWIVCFDKSLSDEQVEEVTKRIAGRLAEEGMWVLYAQHDGGINENKHVHMLTPTRQFDQDGHYKEHKTRQVFANDTRHEIDPKTGKEIDRPIYNPDRPNDIDSGYRIPRLDKDGHQIVDAHGKRQWARVTVEANPWNDRGNVERWRAMIAEEENRNLSPEHQVDHRSYERQGLDKRPTHLNMDVNAHKMHERLLRVTQKDMACVERYAALVEKIKTIEDRPILPEDKPSWMWTEEQVKAYQEQKEAVLRPLIEEKEKMAARLREELRYKPKMEYVSRYDVPYGIIGALERLILDIIHTIRYLIETAMHQSRLDDIRRMEQEIQKLKVEMYLAAAIGASKGMDQEIMTANELIIQEQKRLALYMEQMVLSVQAEEIKRDEQLSRVYEQVVSIRSTGDTAAGGENISAGIRDQRTAEHQRDIEHRGKDQSRQRSTAASKSAGSSTKDKAGESEDKESKRSHGKGRG